jgi:hypothetical protein
MQTLIKLDAYLKHTKTYLKYKIFIYFHINQSRGYFPLGFCGKWMPRSFGCHFINLMDS